MHGVPTKKAIALDTGIQCQQHGGMKTSHPTIIAFASPKGGVGKSTSCLSIASALAKQGHTVHIIDYDQTETLWDWYSTRADKQKFPTLTVEKAPDVPLKDYIHKLLELEYDYLLIDLAGTLTKDMLYLGVAADLTITPSKLNVPDTLQASKLVDDLKLIGKRLGKAINHRILVNDVPTLLSNAQAHTLAEIDRNQLPRFQTIIYTRPAAYTEAHYTGLPPHFSDTSRSTIARAIDEIDQLVAEIHSITNKSEESIAA